MEPSLSAQASETKDTDITKLPKEDPTQKNPPNELVVETTKTKSNNMSKMSNYEDKMSQITRFHV